MSQSVTPCHFPSFLAELTYLLTSWKNSVAERRGVLCGLCCCAWGVEGRVKSARCTQGARCTVHVECMHGGSGCRSQHRRLNLPAPGGWKAA